MKSNQLWSPAKSALDATISAQSNIAGSHFVVIPFGDEPYNSISFDSKNYINSKGSIDRAFDDYITQAKYTHISNVLKAGFRISDPYKDNKIYLLTDGMPNGQDSPENVAAVINDWCANHSNCRLFYVALTEGVINPVIRQAIDNCQDAYIVQCDGKVIPQIADITSDIYTNIEDIDSQKAISFSFPGKHDIEIESTDSLFDVKVNNNSAENGKILVSIRPKSHLDVHQLHQLLHGQDYTFDVQLQCLDKNYFIANPSVTIHISDEVQSKLTLCHGEEELFANGAEWHDSFLWSKESPEKKISWDLAPMFENEMPNSSLTLALKSEKDDFDAWFNGEQIKNNGHFKIEPNQPAILEVSFHHDAATGKRYFSLLPIGINEIDIINDKPTEGFNMTSLRTEYKVKWNPLKTLFVWIAIILICSLLTWIFLLKRIFLPTIKLGSVTILGPGNFYFQKRIKGARKVVLTNKTRSQNLLSRILYGEIKYIKSDFFTSEISIIPNGKKKVKLLRNISTKQEWDISPSSSFKQFDKGTITNLSDHTEAKIEF